MESLRFPLRPADRIEAEEQSYDWDCGPMSLRIVYKALGKNIPEDQLVKELDCDEDGTEWQEMEAHIRRKGFNCWVQEKSNYESLAVIYQRTGLPIIVYWWKPDGETPPDYHYSVVKKVTDGEITIADPGDGKFHTYSKEGWNKLWRDEDGNKSFLVIVPKI